MSEQLIQSKRWYDIDPHTTRAFSTFEHMKPEYRQVFGGILFALGQRLHESIRRTQKVVSIGPDRAIGLTKAQYKRRKEDQYKHLFQGLNSLFTLPDQQRKFFVGRVGLTVYCLNQYVESCNRHAHPEQIEEVSGVISTTLEQGLSGTRTTLHRCGLLDPQAQTVLNHLAKLYEPQDTMTSPASPEIPPSGNPRVITRRDSMTLRPDSLGEEREI